MAIIKCPECNGDVSDKAKNCPHCGYELSFSDKNTSDDGWVRVENTNVTQKKEPQKHSTLSILSLICCIFIILSPIGAIAGFYDLLKNKNDGKKHYLSAVSIGIFVFFAFIFSNIEEEPKEDKASVEMAVSNETEKPSEKEEIKKEETKPKETKKPKNEFLYNLESNLNKKVAKKTYNVLKKKIGFKNLKFIEKMDGTDNYKVKADNYDIVITASDKLYRIFTPRLYTWYENGKVKHTKKKIIQKEKKKKRTEIDYGDSSRYYSMAKEIVTSCLKSPSSADFPSIIFSAGDIAMSRKGKRITVQSYVDSENSFGASIRNNWTVQYKVLDMDTFSYKVLYVNIGGNVLYGKYRK